MKDNPPSSAVWIIRTASALDSLGLPMWEPPRPKADTWTPVRPRARHGMFSEERMAV